VNRLLLVGSLALTVLCVVVSVRTSNGSEPADKVLAHDVFFTLKDRSPGAREALVQACQKYLSGHPGTVFFAAGRRDEAKRRDVNDTDFDVSLHVYFESDAAHEAYQKDSRHLEFIEKMKGNWETVRVFDSWVATAP
jgi:hypothetical protein